MGTKGLSRGFGFVLLFAGLASGQTMPTSARIESIPLELTMPERYQVTEVLEPIRRVTLVAAADGFIRSMDVRLGGTVRESQEIAQIDRAEASARLKMALAELKEKKALAKSGSGAAGVFDAQVEAAEARAELAQVALDRCTLRAPFSGRVVALPACTGQYVLRGTTLAELADVSSLKTRLPVDRRGIKDGAPLTVQIEGQDVAGKVQAILPLPEEYHALRELVTPFASAWVIVANSKGELEPGLRVRPTTVPVTPVATVPKRAVKADDSRDSEGATVQVIRNEYVTNVPVRVLGDAGPERVQITGILRGTDSLVVASSVPLQPGTLVRFGEGTASRGIEGTAPSPSVGGVEAGITAPGTARGRARRGADRSTQAPPANQARPPESGSAPF
jgi:RND family efflux transporter MFP subunit